MEKIKGKHKHLDLSDRIVIEASISAGSSLREIADRLHKDPTTISKELRRHRIEKKPRTSIHHIRCVNQKGCKKKNLCGGICSGRCSKCPLQNCFKICPDYAATTCEKSKRAPYVCNGCKKIAECVSARYFYSAKSADAMYQDTLKTSRTGINMTAEEMVSLDQLVTPLILRGQSLAHIYAAHRSEIPCSQRTLYNYIDHQLLAARNIDLPRKVRYRPRKKKRAEFHQEYLNGRKYEDFKLYLQAHPETEFVTHIKPVKKDALKKTMSLYGMCCQKALLSTI